jgi:hypothetical protein
MDRMRRAMEEDEEGEQDLGGRQRGGRKELKRAMHDLRSALSDRWNASAEEQQRIASILQRAAAEIAGPQKD